MAELRLLTLGPPRAELDGASVEVKRRKALALLVYLAVNGRPHSRDALATLFWPDYSQSRARAYLRRDLAVLNTSLERDWLDADRETIELKPDADLWLDVEQFRRFISASQSHDHSSSIPCSECLSHLNEAAKLYTDDFLAGFTLRDSPEFDEWQFFQAESLRQELASVLERLADIYSDRGEYEAAVPYARRWVALNPLHEPAQRELIRVYDLSGQSAAALRQYEEYVHLLEEELGLPPEEETVTLFEAIKAQRLIKPHLKTEEKRESRPVSVVVDQARNGASLAATADGAGLNDSWHEVQSPPGTVTSTPTRSTQPASYGSAGSPGLLRNLPQQSTSFVGREKEVAEIGRVLEESPCRLLTLIGPGGIGKTRLAIEAAQRLNFRHGVCFVPLAPLSSAASLVSAIADELGLSFHGADDLKEQLFAYLRDQRMLLVLDNFEHLLPSAGQEGREGHDGTVLVAALLERTPHVKILVTSRERLSLSAEWILPVQGLSIPENDEARGAEAYSAVQLFIQRARQVQPHIGWHLTERGSIARICRLVGGMPLGIELAAAWVSVLPVLEIPQEIERNLDFLATSMRDLPERHRSMRAIFDQSWSLLSDRGQVVFRRLSIFRDDFSRLAVEAVAGETAWTDADLSLDENGELQLAHRQFEVLTALSELIDKSFLRQTASGRYEIHELMRQYGEAKLKEDPEDEQLARDRHARYYLNFLAHQETRMKGREQRDAHEKVAREFENIKAGWQWAAEQGHGALLVGAVEAFWLFLIENNLFREADTLFAHTLALLEQNFADGEAPAVDREVTLGILLIVRGGFCMRMGNFTEADFLFDQGIALLRPFEESHWIALALNFKWEPLFNAGAYEEARECLVKSIELSRQAGDRWLAAYSLNDLAMVTHKLGDTATAQSLSQQSLSTFAELDDQRGMAFVFNNLGFFAYQTGDYAEADWLYRESLSVRRVNGDQWGMANVLVHLGMTARARQDFQTAQASLLEAVKTTREIRAIPTLLDALVELAELMVGSGEIDQAGHVLRVSLHHPALSKQAHEKAKQLLAELLSIATPQPTAILPEEEADHALDVLVSELLNKQKVPALS